MFLPSPRTRSRTTWQGPTERIRPPSARRCPLNLVGRCMLNEVSLSIKAKIHTWLEAFVLDVQGASTRNPCTRALIPRHDKAADTTGAAAIRAWQLDTEDWATLLVL